MKAFLFAVPGVSESPLVGLSSWGYAGGMKTLPAPDPMRPLTSQMW
jgi:hypothetical protein